jgi:hypothetical protein
MRFIIFFESFLKISEILKKTMVSERGHALRRVPVSVLAKAGPS